MNIDNLMTNSSQIHCSWNDIKSEVLAINPLLYNIIENDRQLIPNELTLLKYSFGQQVGDDAYFYFPDNQKSETMPFCMVLENHFEMYMEFNNTISPWKIYHPGHVFPYTRFIKNNYLYEPSDILKMSAGIKSSFILLNKFSDKKQHAHLKKKFNLSCDPPKSFKDQFTVMKEICDNAKPNWTATLLAFPKSWEEKAYQSIEFINFLNSIAVNDHIFKKNALLYDYLLNTIILKHRITSNGFVKEVIKYLFHIACGEQPAYIPSLCEKNGPVAFLREIYTDVYRSDSSPIFMAPHKLTPFESKETAYYSLNKIDFLFKPESISNVNKLSQEIKTAFTKTCEELTLSNTAKNTLLYKCTTNLELDLTHRWNIPNDKNNLESIAFFKDQNVQFQLIDKLDFPMNSQFLTGCFSLRYRNNPVPS